MLGRLEIAAAAKNGGHPSNEALPALTLDDVLVLWDYFDKEARRNMVDWDWYPMALCGLGYEKEGDKFDHAKQTRWATEKCLANIWGDWLPSVVADLTPPANPSPKVPSKFAPSKNSLDRWRRVARVAWARMKKERKIPTPPMPPPRLPPMPKFPGWLLLAAVAFYLFEKE